MRDIDTAVVDSLKVLDPTGRLEKSGLKAIGVLLTLRRHSKRHANWTLSIAILSTLVTIGLFALYLMQDTPEFP